MAWVGRILLTLLVLFALIAGVVKKIEIGPLKVELDPSKPSTSACRI
jgi:hypothetical protein